MTEEEKIFAANWDDSNWWIITERLEDGKFKVWLSFEGEQDDPKARMIVQALNNELEKATDEGVDLIKNFHKGYLSCIEQLHEWNGGMENPCHLDVYNKLLTMERKANERASELLK